MMRMWMEQQADLVGYEVTWKDVFWEPVWLQGWIYGANVKGEIVQDCGVKEMECFSKSLLAVGTQRVFTIQWQVIQQHAFHWEYPPHTHTHTHTNQIFNYSKGFVIPQMFI